jgi:anti-anti-sigma factor
MDFSVSAREEDGRVVLAVAGEIDLATAPALKAALARAEAADAAEVWIDLRETGFMDSSGLSALVGAHQRLGKSGRRLWVICPPGPPRRAIEISGLDTVLRLSEG